MAESEACPQCGAKPAGVMAQAVAADLEGITVADVPGGYTYASIAQWLAGVIDSRGSEDGPSATAKLADQLGKAMAALTGKAGGGDGDDDFRQFSESLSEPVVQR